MHLQEKADEAAGLLVEVAEPPLEEEMSAATAEEPEAPETGTGVAVTVGQLQVSVCELRKEAEGLQAQLHALRQDVTLLAREEFDRLLAEVIQEEAAEKQEEQSLAPSAAPKRRHSSWWAG